MSDKNNCNCGGCGQCGFCCNGYVRDAKKPNRYVNLETGKKRDLDKKKVDGLSLFLMWVAIALLLASLTDMEARDCRQPGQTSASGTSKDYCRR